MADDYALWEHNGDPKSGDTGPLGELEADFETEGETVYVVVAWDAGNDAGQPRVAVYANEAQAAAVGRQKTASCERDNAEYGTRFRALVVPCLIDYTVLIPPRAQLAHADTLEGDRGNGG